MRKVRFAPGPRSHLPLGAFIVSTITVVHLVLVLLGADGQTNTQVREFPNVNECKQAEGAAHDAAKIAGNITDVGTICVKSEFDAGIKPRA
jgi:hypothetical protein